jgi:transcription elongation factor/antiterminator RfaH
MKAASETLSAMNRVSSSVGAGERWYVVRTQPHREPRAVRQLENQGFRVFLPRYFKSRRHARKFETVLAPLFPRYMFIILDLTLDRWRSVNGTYGVDRLLMVAGEPQPVVQGLVEQLAGAADQNDVIRFNPTLQQGQPIQVTAGPFVGLMGILERLDDSGRVRVLLEIMGGRIPVLLSETVVSPIQELGSSSSGQLRQRKSALS